MILSFNLKLCAGAVTAGADLLHDITAMNVSDAHTDMLLVQAIVAMS